MHMVSRYGIFCKVIENGNFTKVAKEVGYSQSAISQSIKALEQELGTILIDRKKEGITLTDDGKSFYPYIQAIFHAELSLKQKQQEMKGLEHSVIRIGTFTSVSRNILPQLMKSFKSLYPTVNFVLKQGEYTSIKKWILHGEIDFGFVNSDVVSGINMEFLYRDEMMAVLPKHHKLANLPIISLDQLAKESFILLDEGRHSVIMHAFADYKLEPQIEYKVYDDYSILAMVKQGLGISAMYSLVLNGFEEGLAIRPIKEHPERNVALAWQNWDTMSLASRKFVEFIKENFVFVQEKYKIAELTLCNFYLIILNNSKGLSIIKSALISFNSSRLPYPYVTPTHFKLNFFAPMTSYLRSPTIIQSFKSVICICFKT